MSRVPFVYMPPSYRLETKTETGARVSGLVWGAIGRSFVRIVPLGAVLGGVFGAVLLAFAGPGGMLSGLAAGAVVGGLLGLVEVLLIAVQLASTLTRTPFAEPLAYYSIMRRAGIASVLAAYALISLAAGAFLGELGAVSWWGVWFAATVLPLLVNLAAVWWTGRRVADWMLGSVIGEPQEAPRQAYGTSDLPPQGTGKVYRASRKRQG